MINTESLGMVDPERMDPPDKPFSYFAHPNDVLGAWGAPVAVEVTPEGYLYTGFGELMVFTGNPPEPVEARIRTRNRGYLPVIEYDLDRDGVRYFFQCFAADLGGDLRGMPVSFLRVTVTNTLTSEPRTPHVSAAWRFSAPANAIYSRGVPDYRFRQKTEHLQRELVEGQTDYDPSWTYAWCSDALLRDDRMLYVFPTDPAPKRTMALGDAAVRMVRFFSGEVEGERGPGVAGSEWQYHFDAHAPLGVTIYCLPLGAGQSRSLDFRLPLTPLPGDSSAASQVRGADIDALFRETMAFWEGKVAAVAPFSFPEAKVQEYLLANTVSNLLAIDQIGDDTVVNVNKFQYHHWYGGCDTGTMVHAFELMGLLDDSRQALLYFLSRQRPDGVFPMFDDEEEPRYWELFGWNLWNWGRHYQLTRDRTFLETVYPGVLRAVAWHERITAADEFGVFPTTTISDDAYLKDCRQTGQHFWALIGLRHAVFMAREMGRSDEAARFEAQAQRFRAAFERLLEKQTALTGGYIPPALDRTTAGNDWDNLLTLYPEVLFDPEDPRVDATLNTTRARYQEGLLAYTWPMAIAEEGDEIRYNEQPGIHYWQSPNNAQTLLVRGHLADQEEAVRILYALLLHTTSTHLPGEFGTIPWSTRDVNHAHNLLPQGLTGAKTIELIRNMLVREQGEDLVLLSALSPEWLQPDNPLEVRDAPTSFGPLSFTVKRYNDRIIIRLPAAYRWAPKQVRVRVPWFFDVQRAELDGSEIRVQDGHVLFPLAARELVLVGATIADAPQLSYEQAVADYKAEYRRRYITFLRTGKRVP